MNFSLVTNVTNTSLTSIHEMVSLIDKILILIEFSFSVISFKVCAFYVLYFKMRLTKDFENILCHFWEILFSGLSLFNL